MTRRGIIRKTMAMLAGPILWGGILFQSLGHGANQEETALTGMEQAYNEAVRHLESNRREEARQAFLKVVDMDSDDAERDAVTRSASWNNIGTMALEEGQLSRADAALGKAVEYNPEYGLAWNNMGALRLLQGRYGEAIEAYERAIRTSPGYVEGYNNMARLHVEAGRYRDAGQLLLQTIRLGIANEQTLTLLARIYEANSLQAQADGLRTQWVQLAGGDLDAMFRVAGAYLELNIPHQARKLAEAIREQEPSHPGLLVLEGRVALAEGNWEKAVSDLKTAVKNNPANVLARNDLVVAALRSEQKDRALAFAREGTRETPDDAHVWFLLGTIYDEKGERESAAVAYRNSIARNPRHSGALMNLGILAASKDQAEEAAGFFEKALHSDPYNADLHYNYGRILTISDIDYERGLRMLGFAAQGAGESARRARDFVNRLHDGVFRSSE